MRYVSLFSGIEAASVAWQPLGWEAVAFAEIEPFPCAVLAERFPNVPNLGDVTKIDWEEFRGKYGSVDIVCGGSPCQSFSIAGGRESLDGESRLMFEYIRAVQELRPRWYVWVCCDWYDMADSDPYEGRRKLVDFEVFEHENDAILQTIGALEW